MIRHMEKQKGIQTTLFDYFKDTEYYYKVTNNTSQLTAENES